MYCLKTIDYSKGVKFEDLYPSHEDVLGMLFHMNPLGGRALEIIDSMRSAPDWIREIECDSTINLTPACTFQTFITSLCTLNMRFLSAIVNKPCQIPQQVLLFPRSFALRGFSFHGIYVKCVKSFSRLIRRHANAIRCPIYLVKLSRLWWWNFLFPLSTEQICSSFEL